MSTPKELIFEETARNKLREGIDNLAKAVCITLGPQGRNVGLQASWGTPKITNDGNSIVKDIELKDTYANMGVTIGKEVASKMKEKCGDGTTTSLLLLNALVQTGVKNIASGASPIHIKRGIDKAVEKIVSELESMAIKIKTEKETKNIAIASASGNEAVGTLISNAIQKVGRSGVITIEEGKSTETTIDMVEGMQFDRGYVSPYFATDAETMTSTLHAPRILITDKKISSAQDILPLLQAIAASQTSLLIIADDIESDAMSTLIVNKIRGTLKVAAVKTPGFGDRRKAYLQDIAVLTGGTLISEETGLILKNATIDLLGKAEKVMITKEKTVIVNGMGNSKEIAARIKQIDGEIGSTTSSYDKEKLEERKAKLGGGVAIIRVGATSEPEAQHKKQLFEDSLNSTRSALEEGVVTGGGVALLRASRSVEKTLKLDGDEAIGAKMVFKACEAPVRQIIANAGLDPSLFIEKILSEKPMMGFNAMSESVEDLVKAGIIDPVKVEKHALRYAASSASVVLLSEVLIANAPEEDEQSSHS